jgi:Holliday junction resolvasome RuvABC endonuclease subunit
LNILALDLGTTTGWAFRSLAGKVYSGAKEFKTTRFDGGGVRYVKFEQWLKAEFYGIDKPDWLVFEEVRRHLSTDSSHAYGGFLATLQAWGEKNKVPYQGVPVGTIKQFATGAGNADKETMILACLSFGIDPVDDNEADAVCLLNWALAQQNRTPRRMAKTPQ